jgi:hypothetical protein
MKANRYTLVPQLQNGSPNLLTALVGFHATKNNDTGEFLSVPSFLFGQLSKQLYK